MIARLSLGMQMMVFALLVVVGQAVVLVVGASRHGNAGWPSLQTMDLIVFAAVSLGVLALARLVVWGTKARLHRAVTALQAFAAGDLRPASILSGDGEMAELAGECNRARESIRGLLELLSRDSQSFGAVAEELAQMARQSGDGATRQHSELRIVDELLAQMSDSLQAVAQNAESAAAAARGADAQAATGSREVTKAAESIDGLNGAMENAAAAIQQLRADSEKIASVVDVIKNITEQTNLLALNAAIEAARAGEHGKGFAVVAEEVRELAGRTRRSTQQIVTMVESLKTAADHAVQAMEHRRGTTQGTALQAGTTEKALRSITEAVEGINATNATILSAVNRQREVVESAHGNVQSIGRLAGEATSLVSRNAELSARLSQLATQLSQRVGAFQL